MEDARWIPESKIIDIKLFLYRNPRMSNKGVADHFGIGLSSLYRITSTMLVERSERNALKPVLLGSREETYFDEETLLNPPVYTCSNKHLITPINPDWKLY